MSGQWFSRLVRDTCHVLNRFYGLKRVPNQRVRSFADNQSRQIVFDFKNGRLSSEVACFFRNAVTGITGGRCRSHVAAFVPASTRDKTCSRFLPLAKNLSETFNIFASVKIVQRVRDATAAHMGQKSGQSAADFRIDGAWIRNRPVILFDYVITRGTAFADTAKALMARAELLRSPVFFWEKPFIPGRKAASFPMWIRAKNAAFETSPVFPICFC
ncbi:MAG: hypothetical protein IJ523_01835 [Succinivibrionaceae bacterium]|nr:hypothetical protein [Succinivibrionaceae bacterium]